MIRSFWLAALFTSLSAPWAWAEGDPGAGLGPDLFAFRARRVLDTGPANPAALALSDIFGEGIWDGVKVSTHGPAYDLTQEMRKGAYKLEVIQLILMSLDGHLTLAQTFEKRAKGKKGGWMPLAEIAGTLGLDYDEIYERSLAVQKWLDGEFLPWYGFGEGVAHSPDVPRGQEGGSGEEAYRILEKMLLLGNRHAGAPMREKAIAAMAASLESRGLEVERESFVASDPRTAEPRPMTNLIGRFNPKASCRVLLGSHFDTRHTAEEDSEPARRAQPIAGANDGTSGVAVLLALSSRLQDILPAGMGADIVLFDGEEMGYPDDDHAGYCAGSRHMAKGISRWAVKPRFGIILDMVCDSRGIYKTELHSMQAHPKLVDALWAVGERLSPKTFSRSVHSIIDDHVPLSKAGVPSALVIGYNYPEWHTSQDTVDKCSARRLGLISDVLEEFLRTRSLEVMGDCS